jgi:hypothetical protein
MALFQASFSEVKVRCLSSLLERFFQSPQNKAGDNV